MKITYIAHSGFLVEWNQKYFLFDYYKGNLPKLNPEYDCTVFVSHKHHDHYNPIIWELDFPKDRTTFILSSDLDRVDNRATNCVFMKPHETIEINGLTIETLQSTDEGVAFIVAVDDRIIYHAGDLNLWKWNEETDNYNKKMTDDYINELNLINGRQIDVAFLPLDPRQEEYAFEGIQTFLRYVKVDIVFPMHLWDDYSLIDRFNEHSEKQLIQIEHDNQTFMI